MRVSGNYERSTSVLLACGVLAGPLFAIVFSVLGATRADYDLLRHPVSSLAIGDIGWTQILNFLVAGLLVMAFAVGMRRVMAAGRGSKWGPRFAGLIAVGLLGAGVFVADPSNGYPPGTPLIAAEATATGTRHDSLSALVFFGFPAAGIAVGRWFRARAEPAWASYSIISGVAFLAAFILTSLGLGQVADGAFADIAGLLQRITLVVGFTWLTLLAVKLRAVLNVDPPPRDRDHRV